MEDQEIVALYWSRSERAIAESEAKYGRLCRSVAQRIVRVPEDAEECVQDTWLRAWDAIPPAQPVRLSAFFGRLTRNAALDRLRFDRRARRGGGEAMLCYEELEGCLSGTGDPEALVDALALRRALNDFLAALPSKTRVIFLRRYWYFQPVREIADALGLGQSKVKMTLLRTRNALKKHLEQEELL